jgi:hypothetical protein
MGRGIRSGKASRARQREQQKQRPIVAGEKVGVEKRISPLRLLAKCASSFGRNDDFVER